MITKTLNSNSTDPTRSSPNFFSWIKVIDGAIMEIGEDRGREGGVIWTPNFTANGNLKKCMESIQKDWPNLYKQTLSLSPINFKR